jgi:hypothetical protein
LRSRCGARREHSPGVDGVLTVNLDVAAALRGAATTALCEQRFGHAIVIEPDPGYDHVRFQIAPA